MRRVGLFVAVGCLLMSAVAWARPLVSPAGTTSASARSGATVLEAVRIRSDVAGTARAIRLRLSGSGSVRAGLYTDGGGRPGSLIASGSAAGSRVWRRVAIHGTRVRAGRAYWIAVIARSTALGGAGCHAGRSASSGLPRRWHGTAGTGGCPIAAYLTGQPATESSATQAGAGASSAAILATAASVSVPPLNKTAPWITGSTQVGKTLTANRGSWMHDPTSFSYQWQDCSSSACSNISGATATTYGLTQTDVGYRIDVVVTARNAVGSTAATSAKVSAVTGISGVAPTSTAAPAISGTTQQGKTLQATAGSWAGSPTSYAYQWRDCTGSACANVSGATSSSYTLASGDVGNTVEVVVTATNATGSASAASTPAGPVAATPVPPAVTAVPVISGSAQQGQTLQASTGSWSGTPTSYAYQWQDCSGSCSNISGATSSSYTLAAGDVGDTVDVVVTATNGTGATAATSAATATVTATSGGGTGSLNGIEVHGNQLVTGSGSPVVLHGVDQAGTEYDCTEGYGIFDNGSATLSGSASDTSTLAAMQPWGVNSVFIGLNEDCWLGINGAGIANWSTDSGQNYINAIKAAVASAEADGMYPVIGFFWGDPGTEVPTGNDPNGGGQPALPDADHAPLFWEEVADTFKNDPNVILRLQEEPHPANVGTALSAWQCWSQGDVQFGTGSVNAYGTAPTPTGSVSHCSEKATNGTTAYQTVGMQSMVNIIRGTGATNVIQVPGLAYANMAACSSTGSPTSCGMLDSTDGVRVTDPLASGGSPNGYGAQLMADFDMYPDTGQICDTTTCYADTLAPVAAAMPIDLGEIGPNGATDTAAVTLLNWADSLSPKLSYYAWAWDTWTNLISNWSGTPTPGWGTDYYDHITGYTPPPPAQPTDGITLTVQAVPGTNIPSSPSFTVSKAVSAGDDLFLVAGGMGYTTAAQSVTGVSDNVNGAWTRVTMTGSQLGGNNEYAAYSVFEFIGSKAAAAGAMKITLTGTNTAYSSGGSTLIDASGVASVGATAFDTAVQPGDGGSQVATTFTSPSLASVPAGDVVLGLFGGYSHSYQGFSATGPWNMYGNSFTVGQSCGASAVDWEQPTTTGPVSAQIVSASDEYHYSGAIDLHP